MTPREPRKNLGHCLPWEYLVKTQDMLISKALYKCTVEYSIPNIYFNVNTYYFNLLLNHHCIFVFNQVD